MLHLTSSYYILIYTLFYSRTTIRYCYYYLYLTLTLFLTSTQTEPIYEASEPISLLWSDSLWPDLPHLFSPVCPTEMSDTLLFYIYFIFIFPPPTSLVQEPNTCLKLILDHTHLFLFVIKLLKLQTLFILGRYDLFCCIFVIIWIWIFRYVSMRSG